MIELQVLNYLLDSKDTSLISLNNLDKRYFSEYSSEWNYIYNHYKEYGNIPDKETFVNIFPDFDIASVQESPDYLISELFKEYQKNQLAITFNGVREKLINGDLEGAMALYQNSYDKVATGISIHCTDLLKDVDRYNKYIEKTQSTSKYYVHTGFKELDYALADNEMQGGWDREEELAVIIARTNQGKSWFLIKAAAAAVEQGLNVGIYEGEMSAAKVGYRFDTLVSHISNGSIVHGNKIIQSDYEKYIEGLPTRYKGSLKVLTIEDIKGPAGVNALRAFIEKENLDILFVDQYSLLEDDRQAKNPVERMSNIAVDMKNLQMLKRIPIIAVSQMNRNKNEDGTDDIDSTQIAQSDRIGQNATTIIGINRDKKDKSLMHVHLVKLRDSGGVGDTLSYIVDFNVGKFIYIPEEKKSAGVENVNKENSPAAQTEDAHRYDVATEDNGEDNFV